MRDRQKTPGSMLRSPLPVHIELYKYPFVPRHALIHHAGHHRVVVCGVTCPLIYI